VSFQLVRSWLDPDTQIQSTSPESFGYDAVGNRVQQVFNNETTVYTYLPYNKMETAGEYTFSYDAHGNTVSKIQDTDEWLYSYDTANRLTEVQHNSQTIGTYVYNGDGQRIKKTEWNPNSQQYETIIYLYSYGNVYYEKNMTTGFEASYLYGPTGRTAKKAGEEVMYYHTDQLGSTRMVTDTAGNPVTSAGYNPFGGPEITGEHEQYLFTGHELDSTGLYYCKARYYDPDTGRFLTQDAWSGDKRRPQSLNKYVYCVNNPLKYRDPSGNRVYFHDEIAEDLVEENTEEENPPSNVKGPQSDEEAYLLGYWLSFYYSYKMTPKIDTDEFITHKQKMEEFASELFPDDPESFKLFMWGCDNGFSDGKYAFHEDSNKRLDTEVTKLEQDVQCLMDLASDELIGIGENLGSFPESIDACLVVVYIAEEMYNLTCTDKYGEPPSDLVELCREEEETGSCLGSILLCVFIGLAVPLFTIHKRRRRRSNL
jgi:RHS repeat-associated protein